MRLKHLKELTTSIFPQIAGITGHSGEVQQGYLFIALTKNPAQRRQHCAEAQARGAKFILLDQQQINDSENKSVTTKSSPTILALADLAQNLPALLKAWYNRSQSFQSIDIDQLQITGVTGTNGKSSVSYYIFQLINHLQLGVAGLVNTAFWGLENHLMSASMTTPDICTLYRQIAWMAAHGATHIVMECSSHGLAQNRVAGLNISTAVFTNLSRDHLDYHKSMQAYAASKKKTLHLT